ncbi:MAG TPA: hypothetical protein VNZ47_06190 [Candidatus Dormibacteraeota bacterium]|jgi:hypothetical protein|nr:hypothetical protein [Candidatus Dormibacteraeota bacterium]
MNDEELLEKYVATFPQFDEMVADEFSLPGAVQLAVEDTDQYGRKLWKPVRLETPPSQLQEVYAELPARFPRLFERMVLSYRWAEVDLGTYRLVANPPGQDLSGLRSQLSQAPALWASLLPAGFIQFGKGPDLDFDPVCFDIKTRKQGGDCRIVKIDHEEILCNNRAKVVAELAPSFHQLVLQTIELASKVPPIRPV